MCGLNGAQCVWQFVCSIMHFAKFGRDPKHPQHQYFPEQMVKKKKRTQRRARLHGNAATGKKNGKDLKEAVPRAETYFYLFISLQSSFPVGAEPGGGRISPKKHKAKSQKYLGWNKSFGISTEQQTWPRPAPLSVAVDCFAHEKYRHVLCVRT